MKSQQIILAGIGMGSGDVITEEVRQLIEEADCLIGAERMITSAQKIRSMNGLSMRQCEGNNRNEGVFIKEYRTEEIVSYIKEHKEHSKIGILLSGDTGFYSGAKKLKERLTEVCSDQIEIYSGISSLSYLASKVGVSWEDAKILSLHGKDMNFVQTIHRHQKTFLLLGGKDTGRHFYETLLEYGLGDVQVHVGCQMSYEEEKILSGKLYEMKAEDFEGLCAVLVENPSYYKAAGMHLKDEEFLRGKVPMTKSEVRSVSIAELELTEDAIVYDIGAGTGSVSIEIARAGEQIRVYAIEKNPEGVKLIDQNRKKFRTDGVRIIEGLAPQALGELETPTHAFVGGSSGNLREIVQLLQKKNPDVCELVRGKTGRVYGDLFTLLTMLKGIPLAYNKDMQEDKEAVFDAIDTVKQCLRVLTPMFSTMQILKDNMKKAALKGFINATDCADYLTKKGMPFRDAYKTVGQLVAQCVREDKSLADLTLEEYKTHSDAFENDVYEAIDLKTCVRGRKVIGGLRRK
mgnify:CR=1 FL=1